MAKCVASAMEVKAEYASVNSAIEALRDRIQIDDAWSHFKDPNTTKDLDKAAKALQQVKNKGTFYNNLLASGSAAVFKKHFATDATMKAEVVKHLPVFQAALSAADTELQMVNETFSSRASVTAKAAARLKGTSGSAAKKKRLTR